MLANPTSRARSIFSRKNSAFVIDEATGKTVCRKCGAEAVLRAEKRRGKINDTLSYRCDKCEYKRRRAIHPPEHPRIAKAKPARQSRLPRRDHNAWPSFLFSRESDWGRCYTHFLASAECESTLVHYRQALTLFFTEFARKMPDTVTREDCLNFIHGPGLASGRVGKPPSNGTRSNRLSILRSFYTFAASFGIVNPEDGRIYPLLKTLTPTAGIKRLSRDLPPYKSLSAEELGRFFQAIGPTITPDGRVDLRACRDRAIYLCFFWSARRRSEILDLRLQDIESGVIVDGNTRRPATIYHFRGKGHKGIDDVNELPVEAAEALNAWLIYSGKLRDGKPTDPLFTSLPGSPSQYGYDPERPLAPHTIHAQIKRYALKSGIDPARISCHSFRHTAARCRFEASGDLRAVQRLLRHTNISTTDTYLAVLAGKADPTASLLSARFGNL